MPRKHRDVRTGLEKKGFSVEESRKHIHFVYVDLQGRTTTARTMISHGASGADIDDRLLGRMAQQVGLEKRRFLELIDCPMTQQAFDEIITEQENKAE
jgi:hypothetical protein